MLFTSREQGLAGLHTRISVISTENWLCQMQSEKPQRLSLFLNTKRKLLQKYVTPTLQGSRSYPMGLVKDSITGSVKRKLQLLEENGKFLLSLYWYLVTRRRKRILPESSRHMCITVQ